MSQLISAEAMKAVYDDCIGISMNDVTYEQVVRTVDRDVGHATRTVNTFTVKGMPKRAERIRYEDDAFHTGDISTTRWVLLASSLDAQGVTPTKGDTIVFAGRRHEISDVFEYFAQGEAINPYSDSVRLSYECTLSRGDD